ncbi:MAG: 2Fe-2S iron-sulfur cluster binding domain-containing protein [Rhodobacteraceae bacterium]|nr:2Fe-2S iron-sulfur cluster binding domain-containing protein [Paracoccaceae bacterium]
MPRDPLSRRRLYERYLAVTGTHIITLANREGATIAVEARRPLLDTLREQGVDLPYGCKYGGCVTCAAKLVSGEVDQRRQTALNNRQLAHGFVLLCVARALSDCTLEIGVESHDKLYRNPFLDPLEPHELKAGIATPKDA